jgi:HEPN domain-containing protein
VDSTARNNLYVSERNLAVASFLITNNIVGINSRAFEWPVVASFYSVVRGINAYLIERFDESPRTHSQRARAIHRDPELAPILPLYSQLENWSRDARYTTLPSAFDERLALEARETAQSILTHVKALLESA